jgi:hypothetical protein
MRGGPAPRANLDQLLNALLIEWYEWFSSYQLTRGNRTNGTGVTQDYRAPGHMDWWNGAADQRADNLQVRQVDAAIHRIPNNPERWRTALEFQARNLAQRSAIWSSPLLPADKATRDVLLLEARNRFALELRKDGVIG